MKIYSNVIKKKMMILKIKKKVKKEISIVIFIVINQFFSHIFFLSRYDRYCIYGS